MSKASIFNWSATVELNRWFVFVSVLMVIVAMGCQPTDEPDIQINLLETPGVQGGESRLHAAGEDQLYLSWTEYVGDSVTELRYSVLKDGEWSPARMIVSGTNWFTNWADFPSFVQYIDQPDQLAVHWLEYRGEGTYEYDINICQSIDAGNSWLPSVTPHRDGVKAEHGFVSMLPLENGRIFLTWLDGRNMGSGGHNHGHNYDSHGAMSLRTAEIDPSNALHRELMLDSRVCECCQTDAALTSSGPVVVYRDRSEEEVRDIYFVRRVHDEWSSPKAIHADGWRIGGCPVNGPAIAARNQRLAVAWYTEAHDTARIKLAFSRDGGETFLDPISIDDGSPLGRVDVEFLADRNSVLATWIEGHEDTHIKGRIISTDGEKSASFPIHSISPARSSGFPQLEYFQGKCFISWTEVEDERQWIPTAEISL